MNCPACIKKQLKRIRNYSYTSLLCTSHKEQSDFIARSEIMIARIKRGARIFSRPRKFEYISKTPTNIINLQIAKINRRREVLEIFYKNTPDKFYSLPTLLSIDPQMGIYYKIIDEQIKKLKKCK